MIDSNELDVAIKNLLNSNQGMTAEELIEILNINLPMPEIKDRMDYKEKYETEKHRADVAEEALKDFLKRYEERNREDLSYYGSFSNEPIETSVQQLMQKELHKAEQRLNG